MKKTLLFNFISLYLYKWELRGISYVADRSYVPIHENVNLLWYTFPNPCQIIPIYHVQWRQLFSGHLWNYGSRRSCCVDWMGENRYLFGSFSTTNYAKRIQIDESTMYRDYRDETRKVIRGVSSRNKTGFKLIVFLINTTRFLKCKCQLISFIFKAASYKSIVVRYKTALN